MIIFSKFETAQLVGEGYIDPHIRVLLYIFSIVRLVFIGVTNHHFLGVGHDSGSYIKNPEVRNKTREARQPWRTYIKRKVLTLAFVSKNCIISGKKN